MLKQLVTDVAYLVGSEEYKLAWSGSSPKICFAMTAPMSFLLFPDGLSSGGSLDVEADFEQS